MTKAAYIIDIFIRSFFVFIVCYLIIRNWILAILATLAINLVFELIWGKKHWRAFAAQPKKPRRSFKQVMKDLWTKIFSRERTKGFVWAGVVILLMSFVVRLNVYYIVFACLVFTLAAVSRFAPPIKHVTIQGEHSETIGEQTEKN